MIEGLPWPAWLGIAGTGWAIVTLYTVAILRGRIVPRKTHEDTIHESQEWRTESRIKDQQIAELTDQNSKMLNAFGPTLTDFLRGLRRAGLGTEDGDH